MPRDAGLAASAAHLAPPLPHSRAPDTPLPPPRPPAMSAAPEIPEISYIDYETFLAPSFSPHAFASTLISSTNDPSDPVLDLSTPLSRVLFDLQEIDTHIHTLSSGASQPLLSYTATSHAAASRILDVITQQTAALTAAYVRLENDVLARSVTAAAAVEAAQNLHATTAVLRELGRALVLARHLEIQIADIPRDRASPHDRPSVRAAHSVVELRKLFAANGPALDGVDLARDLQALVVVPAESALAARAAETIGAFSMVAAVAPGTAFAVDPAVVAESQRPAVEAAMQTLFLLRPRGLAGVVGALVGTQVAGAVGVLTRALGALTTLERALGEVAARCRTVVAVEGMLGGVGLAEDVLREMDTGALSTSFFRAVAAGWEPRVREVVARGGANARILRAGRDRLREGVRGCVLRGLDVELADEGRGEFEVAVMVGAVGSLGR